MVLKSYLKVFCVALIFVAIFQFNAQASIPYPSEFRHITSQDGLPQNTIRAIFQDSRSLMWFGTDDGLVRYDGYNLTVYRREIGNPHSLTDSYISSISETSDHHLLVGTLGGGLHLMDVHKQTFKKLNLNLPDGDVHDISKLKNGSYLLSTGAGLVIWDGNTSNSAQKIHIKNEDGSLFGSKIKKAIEDDDGIIWLAMGSKGLVKYHPKKETSVWYLQGKTPVSTLHKDKNGIVWVGSESQGLIKIIDDGEQIAFEYLNKETSNLPSNDVMSISETPKGDLVIGTWGGGLSVLQKDGKSFQSYSSRKDDSKSLISNLNMRIYADRDGNIWFGSYDKGISFLDPKIPFRNYKTSSNLDLGLHSDLIWSFAESKEHLWVGTAKGISRINKSTWSQSISDTLLQNPMWKEIEQEDARSLLIDDHYLWVGTKKHGLFRLDTETGLISPLSELVKNNQKLTNRSVRLLLKDSANNLWIGTQKGLSRLNKTNGELTKYPIDALPHYRIRSLYEDQKGRVWVGTPKGLSLFNKETDTFKTWQHDPKDFQNSLAGPMVQSIAEDETGNLWVGTTGGVSVFDPETGRVNKNIRPSDGLPSSGVYGVLIKDGFIWASTMRGLAKINMETYQVDPYFVEDGLPDNEFNFNAYKKLSDGRLVFGSVSGFTVLSSQENPNTTTLPDMWQSMSVNNEPVNPNSEISEDKDRLKFSFGTYNYGSPQNTLYKYKISGPYQFESSWSLKRDIEFVHLPSGQYSFQAFAKDRHGLWKVEGDKTSFKVKPPLLQSPIAYSIYLIGFIGMGVGGAKLNRLRLKRRNEHLEQLLEEKVSDLVTANRTLHEEQERSKQVYESHKRLFRALTHELKTPLSVASSAVQELIRKEHSESVYLANASLDRLDSLLSRIMEVDKENYNEGVPASCNPSSVLSDLLESYIPLANSENKKLISKCELPETFNVPISSEQLALCVGNLISNAIKYSHENNEIFIRCRQKDEFLTVSVIDNGIGIAKSDEKNIWDWFSQGSDKNSGWGIGLAYVKETVEAHNGTVGYENNQPEGSCFTITLPVQLSVQSIDELEKAELNLSILIIEDEADLRTQLKKVLPESWNVKLLPSTEGAFKVIQEDAPDIILTDLMLPGEDGLSFVKRLRADNDKFHIPVVMLTAYNEPETQQQAYELSVDSFLTKPFRNDVLINRISGIVRHRRELLQNSKLHLLKGYESTLPKQDDAIEVFLAKLHSVTDSIDDLQSITLKDLAPKMALGERTLQRRFEEAGISWRDYKTLRRLRHAMHLLKETDMKVTEVADELGFSSSAHFSKAFKEQTGQSPSVWRKNT